MLLGRLVADCLGLMLPGCITVGPDPDGARMNPLLAYAAGAVIEIAAHDPDAVALPLPTLAEPVGAVMPID